MWVHLIPLGCFTVVFSTQSITSEKISGDKIHPCLTPVLTVKDADKSVLWMTLHDAYDLLGNAIVPQNSQNQMIRCQVQIAVLLQTLRHLDFILSLITSLDKYTNSVNI